MHRSHADEEEEPELVQRRRYEIATSECNGDDWGAMPPRQRALLVQQRAGAASDHGPGWVRTRSSRPRHSAARGRRSKDAAEAASEDALCFPAFLWSQSLPGAHCQLLRQSAGVWKRRWAAGALVWCALAALQLSSEGVQASSPWVTQGTTPFVANMLSDTSVRGSAIVRESQCETQGSLRDGEMPCVLPINANISLARRGAGDTTSVDVSIDVFPGPSCDYQDTRAISYARAFVCSVCSPGDRAPCNPKSDVWYHYPMRGAIFHDQARATVIRIIFPSGFDASNVEIDNNTMVLYNGTWMEQIDNVTQVQRTGPYPIPVRRLRYKTAPQQMSFGLTEPRPAQRPITRVGVVTTFRTGTTWGLRDEREHDGSFDPKRVVDLVTTQAHSTDFRIELNPAWHATQLSQRLRLRLEGLVNRKKAGYMGSSSTQDRRVFAIQIYQAQLNEVLDAENGVTDEIPPNKLLMRYFNNHVNDPCLTATTPSSTVQGVVECPVSATSLNSSKMMPMGEWFRDTRSEEMILLCPPGTIALDEVGVQCQSCPIGYISTEEVSRNCTTCPLGTFADLSSALIPDSGASVCRGCSAGTYSGDTAASACRTCLPGTYSDDGSITCQNCTKGSVSTEPGAPSCMPCPANSSTLTQGMTYCQLKCGAGAKGAGGVEPCEACAPGAFAPEVASTHCQVCAAGSATAAALVGEGGGAVECVECAAGSFAEVAASPACTECPAQSYQGATGATGCYLCPLDARALAAGVRLPAAAVNLSEAYLAAIYSPVAASAGATTTIAETVSMRTLISGATSRDECFANCLPGHASSDAGLHTPDHPCVPCGEGTSTHLIGATTCPPCETGYYTPAPSYLTCLPCEQGAFADMQGSRTCGR